MTVEVHILTHDAEPMWKWAIAHYSTFCSRIVIHDGGPVGWSEAEKRRYPVIHETWDTGGTLNDALAMKLKNECWQGTDADWVICVDADEFVYFPEGPEPTLSRWSELGSAIIKPHGFEMFSDTLPVGSPCDWQIYDELKMGAPDDKWYGKPVIFSPKKVKHTGFGIGAHEARPTLFTGRVLTVNETWPKAYPAVYLLHFHQIGPIELVAERYDATRRRLSQLNVEKKWGNFSPGLKHVQEKRDFIIPRLRKVC